MTADRQEFVRRQRVLANFGELALRSDNLQEILDEGCRLVAAALDTDLAKILEIEQGGDTALVRAGFGWDERIVGTVRIALGEHSSESYALAAGAPIVVENIAGEERFDFPKFMQDHGVVALVNVPIVLPGGQPYGLLQVDAREPRDFGDEDIEFLRTYCMVLGPVIDRLQKVGELQRTEERFRLVVENARDHAIILSDAEDLVTDWFPGAAAIFGWTEEEMLGRPVATIFTPEDQASGAPQWETERAKRDGSAPNLRWHATKDGGRVFLDGQTIALCNEDGSLRGFLKIAQNITDRKQAEDRRAMLQEELQHRVRNVLAMIMAIMKRGDIRGTAEEFRTSLIGRIGSLARTQALITRAEGAGVDLESMIRDELLAQSAREHGVSAHGPAVLLSPKAAEVLTLAIHELTTNATKYGALMQAGGRIYVTWRLVPKDDKDWLELEWQESGVEIASAPERRKGFGTELITRRVPYELKGSSELELRPDGICCRIAFPLKPGDSVLQTDIPAAARDGAGH